MKEQLLIMSTVLACALNAQAQRKVLATDSLNRRVLYFDDLGSLVNANFIPDANGSPYDLAFPSDVFQVGAEIWLVDRDLDLIHRFDGNGVWLSAITGGLDAPRGGTLLGSTVYVTNTGSANGAPGPALVMFSTLGTPLGSFATSGSDPYDVQAVGNELYVSDPTLDRVDRYSASGTLLGRFDGPATPLLSAPLQIAATVSTDVLVAGSQGSSGLFHYDPAGNFLNRIDTFIGARGLFELANGSALVAGNNGFAVANPLGGFPSFLIIPNGAAPNSIGGFDPPPVCSGSITSYCTPGNSSNGCQATMSASGVPSATATTGFVLTCTGVEGQKAGLIFYGTSGPNATPWGTSSSFLCVKAPTQRTPNQNAGGTLGACNGTLSLDFLAFMAATPSAVGNPLAAGSPFNAQAWYRDPPSPKTTHLSDGLEWSMCP